MSSRITDEAVERAAIVMWGPDWTEGASEEWMRAQRQHMRHALEAAALSPPVEEPARDEELEAMARAAWDAGGATDAMSWDRARDSARDPWRKSMAAARLALVERWEKNGAPRIDGCWASGEWVRAYARRLRNGGSRP